MTSDPEVAGVIDALTRITGLDRGEIELVIVNMMMIALKRELERIQGEGLASSGEMDASPSSGRRH